MSEDKRDIDKECESITRDLKKSSRRLAHCVGGYSLTVIGLIGGAFLVKELNRGDIIPYFLNSAYALTTAVVPLVGGYTLYEQGKALLRMRGLIKKGNEERILEQSRLEQDLQDNRIW